MKQINAIVLAAMPEEMAPMRKILADYTFTTIDSPIGDVELGEDASVWPGAVLRGDVNFIRVGARTSLQDGSIVHVSHDGPYTRPGGFPAIIGSDTTVGHGVILHAFVLMDNHYHLLLDLLSRLRWVCPQAGVADLRYALEARVRGEGPRRQGGIQALSRGLSEARRGRGRVRETHRGRRDRRDGVHREAAQTGPEARGRGDERARLAAAASFRRGRPGRGR